MARQAFFGSSGILPAAILAAAAALGFGDTSGTNPRACGGAFQEPAQVQEGELDALFTEYEIRPLRARRSSGIQGPRGGREPMWPSPPVADELYAQFQYEPPSFDDPRPHPRPTSPLHRRYLENVKRFPGSGRFFYVQGDLAQIVAQAFQADLHHFFVPRWMGAARYEIYFEASNPGHDYRLLLQRLLAEKFQLSHKRVVRPVEVLVLRTRTGEPRRARSAADSCRVDHAPEAFAGSGWRILRFRGCAMGEIAPYLGRILGRTVLDETTATGRFDFELSWQGQDTARLQRQLENRLGVALAVEQRPAEVFVVTGARQLEKPVRYNAATR